MFELTMRADSDSFRNNLYDLLQEVATSIIEDNRNEHDLPYMISKAQLAKHIFNVSSQTLDAHIINRPDFPKLKVGERILFPRDMVLEWIRKNIDVVKAIKEPNP
ncbi:helix-turn-helix domain-containing protein [Bacillus sp. LBG-1-113]|uniref:helix-turn-helix domain-containing protein n=1 Tax=Bacillus sp. LBG-1-113 TaxID=2886094 RepID=UPI001E33B9A8|nr:helix-turn-helix domain-containing protein [Bacillus sp. LBG-1-113]MCC2931633.1 helix-turn-helix domain-containing protein [Bacillus sp. LBG-1-113]